MQSSILVLFVASIVILSYFFNIFSKKTKIPTVLLLMSSGMLFNYFEKNQLISMYTINKVVEVLGIMGLIMIILEASLDLHITRKKKGLILKAFISALIILVVSSFSIAYLIHFWLNEPMVDNAMHGFCRDAKSILPSSDLRSHALNSWLGKRGESPKSAVAKSLVELLDKRLPTGN